MKTSIKNAQFDLLLKMGEGQHLEFKQNLSSSLGREFTAFANAEGGRIVIGVDNNNRVVGIKPGNRLSSQIEDIARNCDPPVKISIRHETHDEKTVMIVDVHEGERKPYSCSEGFFLRVGANSQKMKRDELLEFARRVQPFCFDEQACQAFQYPKDFDTDAFRRYLARAEIARSSLSREDILCNLGVAMRKGKRLIFNNAGVLFFAKKPTNFIRQAQVTCLLLAGLDKVHILDRKDLADNLMENVQQAMIFLKRHLSLRYKIEKLKREEILELPEAALREAVLNAVTHRDYHERGACVMVEIYRDRVEISDPGGLPPGLKKSELGHKSVHRNPLIADLFQRIGEVEKVGSGIRRMRDAAKAAGVPAPRFEATGFFTITYRKPVGTAGIETQIQQAVARDEDQVGTKSGLSRDQVDILMLCRQERPMIELMRAVGRQNRTKFRDGLIRPLIEAGLIEYTIPDKPNSRLQKYRLTVKGKKNIGNVKGGNHV